MGHDAAWQKIRDHAVFHAWWRRLRARLCDADRRDDLARYVTIAEAIHFTRVTERRPPWGTGRI